MHSAVSLLRLSPGRVSSGLRLAFYFFWITLLAGQARAESFVDLGGFVNAVRVGNFDGAGLPDLAVGIPYAVVLLAADGPGAYHEVMRYTTRGSSFFDVGDLDGDDDSDVAVVDYEARRVVIIRTVPDGFSLETLKTENRILFSPTIQDVNGDGIGDLLLVSWDTRLGYKAVEVYSGRRDGKLTRSGEIPTDMSANNIAVADVDEDGAADLILTLWFATYGVLVYPGVGDGTFGPSILSAGEPLVYPHQLAIGDFNSDGHLDLAIVAGYYNPYGHPGTSQVRFGNGTDRFDTIDRSEIPRVFDPSGVAVGDLDRDSFADVVFSDGSGLLIYRGRPGNTLGAPERIRTRQSQLGDVQIADLNSDGALDLIVGSTTGVLILWNAELKGPTSTTAATWTDVRKLFR